MRELIKKSVTSLRNEGIGGFLQRTKGYVARRARHRHRKVVHAYVDVLFINGCPLLHPYRYRVQHQREQLAMAGITSDEVYYTELCSELVYRCRAVIIYRCNITPDLKQLVQRAKELNKSVFYDIDDLVIDTRYTDTIPYVCSMPAKEKASYDEGVRSYCAAMQLCDAVITTTEGMAEELAHYMPEVFVNRNTVSEAIVDLSEKAREKRAKREVSDTVTLGYFSGSITHNDDVAMILPVLIRILQVYPQVRLLLVGELDLPEELESYRTQVIFKSFVEWQQLPELIAQADINLVPLCDTVFNAAKSENKWVEAALVGVPTVASDVGALHRMIEHGRTGYLCVSRKDWEQALAELIEHPEQRDVIGMAAHDYVSEHCTTVRTGGGLRSFLLSHRKPNLAMVLPAFAISGGVLVALKHVDILRTHGYDVTVINIDKSKDAPDIIPWDHDCATLLAENTNFLAPFDKAVATMWLTVGFLDKLRVRDKYYLVQNYETNFYPCGISERWQANATYWRDDLRYLTISRWCEGWLRDEFGQTSRYAPNGLDNREFEPVERDWSGRIRILVEGDSAFAYKNVDESFHIVDLLPQDRFEIWYVSYNAKPKKWYRVDKFFQKVPYDEMPTLYRQCHILLKTSILESFSYPPLEMMATGGMVVARPNEGNREYLKHEVNCLLYDPEDINSAVQAIHRLVEDNNLRERLCDRGFAVADSRDWSKCEESILSLYE